MIDIREYISSGILEAYLLGDLSDEQRAEVEANLARFPELRQELRKQEELQEKMIMNAAIIPPSRVRDAVLRKIGSDEGRQALLPVARERFWRYAAAASVLIAITASVLAFHYRSELQQAKRNLDSYIAQNQQMAGDYNSVRERLDKMESDLEILQDPSFKTIVLKATDNAPGASALVYWNSATQELFLDVQNLQELTREKQYQLWAIVDGKPVDAGVFEVTAAGLTKMKPVAGASAFAVTIEPRGGKSSPTLETMQVMGEVSRG